MLNVGLEQQQQIRGADGTLLWTGGQIVATSYMVTIPSGVSGVGMGEAVVFDATNTVIPRQETTAAGASPTADLPMSLALVGARTPAGTGAINFLGVALEPAGTGGTTLLLAKRLIVAGAGSLVSVQTTSTALALGNYVGSSITAGLVAATAVTVATNITLGSVFKINTAGATGTGLTGWAGILVGSGVRVT